jgi:hypothetical protein
MKKKQGLFAGLLVAAVIAVSAITFATNFTHSQHNLAVEDERGTVPHVIVSTTTY